MMARVSSSGDGSVQPSEVTARVERLVALADRRWHLLADADRVAGLDPDAAVSPSLAPGARQRARELRGHARTFLLPRARDLDAPLLVVLLGPTGAGKSSLINALAGAPVSRTGVLRPTTRDAVAVGTAADLARLVEAGSLAGVPAERLETRVVDGRPGIVLADAPDVDSVEHDNRTLADGLLEAADLCLFVTTATRYADRVPWDVLARAEQRRLPVVVVLNRMPEGHDAVVVREDLGRLIAATGLDVRDIRAVPDGALSPDGTALATDTLGPLLGRLEELSRDRDARRALAARALEGALAGVAPLAAAVADDLEHDAREAGALCEHARREYAEQAGLLFERLFSGTVLREEVVRHWHSFVGADQVTRLFATGIGRVRGALATLVHGTPRAPVAVVQEGAADDITSVVASHAAEAARLTASRWNADPRGAQLVAGHPALWSSSSELPAATRETVEDWVRTIAHDVAERGASRRGVARAAALGVNAVAVTLMLATFAHTGGVTGAEAGIAAATAFLNQKLLNALFGEAAVQEMIRRARERLRDALSAVIDDERRRFEDLAGDGETLRALASDLRAAAG
jgi:energy-coupling factor transporter ATP-binding protein EcfA2